MKMRFNMILAAMVAGCFCSVPTIAKAQPANNYGSTKAESKTSSLASSGFQLLQQKMQGYVDDNKLAGLTTLIASRGEIVHFEKYGMQDVENQRPMRENTIFRLASMTKPFTSTAIMMLYEQGRLSLDDAVEKYVPQFGEIKVYVNGELGAKNRSITIKDLLMHTSGITAAGFGNSPVHQMYAESDFGSAANLEDFVAKLAKLPLLHQPGAGWSYGLSTDVLSRVVEVVTGQPFGLFIEQEILQPLGMHDSGFTLPAEKLDRLATVYTAPTPDSLQRLNAPIGAKFPRGNTGMFSTVPDYLRFAQMLLNGGELEGARLLDHKTVELMTRNHLPENLVPISVMNIAFENTGFGLGFSVVVDQKKSGSPKDSSGLGWNRGASSVGAYGWLGAYFTYFWIDPTNQVIGILMAQSTDAMRIPVMAEFHTLAYQALDGDLARK
jgi:CubicO group peptidase (beta-lactamase class C family)